MMMVLFSIQRSTPTARVVCLEAQDATDRHQGWYRLSVEEAVDDYGNNVVMHTV